jgi:hypothetical protein
VQVLELLEQNHRTPPFGQLPRGSGAHAAGTDDHHIYFFHVGTLGVDCGGETSGQDGIEPSSFRFSVGRSDQLSYLAVTFRGNVTLRGTDIDSLKRVNAVTVALDLAESLDPRARSAGLAFLRQRLKMMQ